MKIRDIGEFSLIAQVSKIIKGRKCEDVLVSVGDDCAVVKVGDRNFLFSTDMSIEGVHFLEDKFPSTAVGWKAMVSAWSDIASMGGVPRWALVSWGLPSQTSVGKALSIYEGMVEATNHVGGVILGGDTVRSDRIVIDVVVVGECVEGKYATRSGAKPGDVVAITGALGKSLAGLIALERDLPEVYFWRAQWYPLPRIREGRWFCERGYVGAMIDISDGLLSDARHIAEASGVGINIESGKVLVDKRLGKFCDDYGLNSQELFLRSGEEYELLLTIPKDLWGRVREEFRKDFGYDLMEIGEVTDEWNGVRVDGEELALKGYEHFK